MSKRTLVPEAGAVAPTGAVPSARVGGQGGEEPDEARWQRYRSAKDIAVRDQLILEYTPLVRGVAARVSAGLPTSVDIGDCISYGVFGLIDAIEKYDPDRGIRFEPYAIRRIRGAILDELRALDWIPRSVRAKARALEQAYARLEAALHRTPTEAELAVELELTVEELQTMFSQVALVNVLALDELLGAGEDTPGVMSLGETLADLDAEDPVAAFESQETRRMLAEALSGLTEREQRVIALYYGEGQTLAQIGRDMGVSESRVCQIHTKAMVALRVALVEARH
ncbi:MAG: FliA/WhiG family RNA polymerase sigma factor [Sporichthyaceae bacterium]